MDTAYSKHKDRTPEQTVEVIRSILGELHIETEVVALNHPFHGTHSNHVQIKGTTIGANGKGTTEAYALASGYAELLERIQNGMVATRCYHAHLHKLFGFYHYADERLVDAEEAREVSEGVMEAWLDCICPADDEGKRDLLHVLSTSMYTRDDGKIPVLPYVDVFGGHTTWLPIALLSAVCGSNGLAAGNTMEEAVVQALAEIFERFAQYRIISERLTPPEIPSEYLQLAGLRETIADIERTGRYRVSIFDCSLGRGYPVVMSRIIDKVRGTFGLRFGCHPSFAVAVERTLTEAYQGRTAEQSGSCNSIAPFEQVVSEANIRHLSRQGGGYYPASILAGRPNWEFAPWPDAEDVGNTELLARMAALLRRDGRRLLVRDNSHLGFPAYSVIVPGMNEMMGYGFCGMGLTVRLTHALGSFPRLSHEEERLLLKKAALMEDDPGMTPDDLFARPLKGGKMLPSHVFGFVQLKHGEFARASTSFEQMALGVSSTIGSLYWKAMANYARWRGWGMSREDALATIGKLCPEPIYRKMVEDTSTWGVMERKFPALNCREDFCCDDCQAGAAGLCGAGVELPMFERIAEAMAKSEVSQVALARALRAVC